MECWMLEFGCWMLECWILESGCWMLECWMLDAGCWKVGCWTLDAPCWNVAGMLDCWILECWNAGMLDARMLEWPTWGQVSSPSQLTWPTWGPGTVTTPVNLANRPAFVNLSTWPTFVNLLTARPQAQKCYRSQANGVLCRLGIRVWCRSCPRISGTRSECQ